MRQRSSEEINPVEVRYIKLGPGGRWEAASLDGRKIDFWGDAGLHDLALGADWECIRQRYSAAGVPSSTATGYARELREFYTLGADTLWITFARGALWWCFAKPEVIYVGGNARGEGTRYRQTIGAWRNRDINGRLLTLDTLSGKLTQLAAYRRTICKVAEHEYLVRRINAQEEPGVIAARDARAQLVAATAELIKQLHWADFEVLVDLLFARGGWRRVSGLGGTMKDIDLLLEQPLTGERASVQIKSSADQQVLAASVSAFEASTQAQRFFFVCHSPRGPLAIPTGDERPVHVLTGSELAAATVDQGLSGWLIGKVA
jgi:hypothetical protein